MLNEELMQNGKRYAVQIPSREECETLLHELENDGWVWMNGNPPTSHVRRFGTRMWYILYPSTKRFVWYESRYRPGESTEIALTDLLIDDSEEENDTSFCEAFELLIAQ